MTQGDQFLRKAQLLVTANPASNTVYNPASPDSGFTGDGSAGAPVEIGATGSATVVPGAAAKGKDLSNLRFKFQIKGADTESPNTAIIRVYNLSKSTEDEVIAEFANVIISAGYQTGNFGVIFSGTVKQFQRGREENVDNFLEIRAADGDLNYNYAFVNGQTPPSINFSQRYAQVCAQMGLPQDPNGSGDYITGGVIPRGKVQFGLGRQYLRELATNGGGRWSITNGTAIFVPNTGYLLGEAVVINSATGMVGVPEATDQGIEVTTQLNPLIRIGASIKLNNGDITQSTIKDRFFPNYKSITYVANTSNDGLYRVMVAEHSGDTRGQEWHTYLVCLNINPDQPANKSVAPYGIAAGV